jgi:exosortase/archaeosortase family protein
MITPQQRFTLSMITTAVLLPLLVALVEPMTFVQLRFFCEPAARLSALFLSAPVQAVDAGFLLDLAFPIEVTTECSGIKFFALALAVMVGLAVEHRWSWLWCGALVPIVYATTLFANASRIVSTWYIDALCAPVLGEKFQAGLHGMLGALIFMSVLAALYITLWRIAHEHRNQTPIT